MKKLFLMLIVLFILYLGIQFLFYWFSGGQDNTYSISSDKFTFEVNENSNFNQSVDNYNYKVTIDDVSFSFQIFHDYTKAAKVLNDIRYYKDDNYECILPIFKGNLILMDMICLNNGNYNYYFNLKGKNKDLDSFVASIEEYDVKQFTDTASATTIEQLSVYKENLLDAHYLGINNYKGLYDISKEFNSTVYNISLFDKDVYSQKLSAFVDCYYVVADYNENHEFNEINVVDLVSLDTFTIKSDSAISLDSYIQGVVDNKVYLYDKDHKVQYEIDPSNKSVVVFSSNTIRYYNNGWTTMSVADANKELKFVNSSIDYEDKQYVRIDKIGNDCGYYYLYKQNGENYDVYRMSIQGKDGLIYLFNTKTIDSINYIDNYVYFINGNKIQIYNDEFGVRTLVDYKELQFNKNINFYVFAK